MGEGANLRRFVLDATTNQQHGIRDETNLSRNPAETVVNLRMQNAKKRQATQHRLSYVPHVA